MSEDKSKSKCILWKSFGRELGRRTVAPLSHPVFVMHFLGAIVIVGGIGIWTALVSDFISVQANLNSNFPQALSTLRIAIITFFPALAGSACMQLISAEDNSKALRSFASLMLVISFLLAGLLGGVQKINDCEALVAGVVASLVSLWLWWIANADQRDLLDIENSVGGDPGSDLQGNLDGFTV